MANKKKIFDRLENLNIPNSSKNEIFNLIEDVEKGIDAGGLTKVTYAELKKMRDNGSLAAGNLYRITDYEFTTKQSNTKSAGNVFDIIVLATAENQLSEISCAIQHEGDTYFDDNDLGAWELWYDLDNDTKKYEWADAENGKGVIYRMIDEKRNDCPYDFKNALFYNEKFTTDTTTDKYYYTFSYVVNRVLYDGTVEKQVKNCYGNSMGVYIKSNKKSLNLNIFKNSSFGRSCYDNIFGSSCYDNTFRSGCHSNTFKNGCTNNTFDNDCCYNIFGNDCYYNTFDYFCQYNTFGNYCRHNKFGFYCRYNTFGNYCYSNIFRNHREFNIFGNGLDYHEVDSDKTSITINDEYHDDGSGKLTPIKHPNLSTQPSILPYKFMGQYVYEQLIPVYEGFHDVLVDITNLGTHNPIFLSVIAIQKNGYKGNDARCIITNNEIKFYMNDSAISNIIYYRIVYTSMPEEGDYYGYNNY